MRITGVETAVGDRALDQAHALGRFAQILTALVSEERFQVLDGVALDTGDQGPLDHLVQIDEGVAAQQRIELDLPGGVAAHQSFEGHGLIRREVVHVGARVARSKTDNEIDERLEVAAFLFWLRSPQRRVLLLPAGIRHDVAEQVLLHAPLGEVVALEVEEYVAFGRLGEKREAMLGVERRPEFVERFACVPALLLHAGLVPNAHQCRLRAAKRSRHGIERGQIRQTLYPLRAETLDLPSGYTGHVAEVIVAPSAFLAIGPPYAIVAAGHTLRVCRCGIAEEGIHLTRQQPEVRPVVVDAVLERLEVAAGRDHVHEAGAGVLNLFEQVRIDAKLQDRRRPGIPGELGVVDLVGPVAEMAALRHLAQEIRATGPSVVREGSLVDDVHAGTHLGDGCLNVPSRGIDHGKALVPQPAAIGFLVLHALLLQVFEHRAVSERGFGRPSGGAQIENGKVSAPEEIAQVGGGHEKALGCLLHGVVLGPLAGASKLRPRSPSASAWLEISRHSGW